MNVVAITSGTLLCSVTLCAQVLMDDRSSGGERRLFPSDEAVLDVREARTSLPCVVKPVRAELGYDLGFQTGYQVRTRLRDLAGGRGVLTVIFRVTPNHGLKTPVYFRQKWNVPPIPEDADGDVSLDGALTIGEGDYQVDWLIRDRNERVCSAHWTISAHLPAGKGQFTTTLPPGVVLPVAGDHAALKQASSDSPDKRVTVLLHVGSQSAEAAILPPRDREALLSIIRTMAREPRISRFSVTAFNLDQSRIIFRQDDVREIDFVALDKAITTFDLGTISVHQLAARDTGARFLVDLIGEQVARNRTDALIFLGPKIMDHTALPNDMLRQLGETGCPVFYLSYSPAWSARGGADPIGSAVRHWRGSEFSIGRPVDLLSAWSKIMSRITEDNPWRIASKPR